MTMTGTTPMTGTTTASDGTHPAATLNEVRDALKQLTQAVSRLERTMRASRRKGRSRAPQTEIGEIHLGRGTVERTVTKSTGFLGLGEDRTETVTEWSGEAYFKLDACGPQGRYVAGISKPISRVNCEIGDNRYVTDVRQNDGTNRVLDEFLAKLWTEGWQPTSFRAMRRDRMAFYDRWYFVTLRRTVIETGDPPTPPA